MSEMSNTSPESFEPMGEKQEALLSPEDQTVVEFGLHALHDFLEKKDRASLPSVIVLPETSARPLYYAIAPIVKEVYAREHLSPPKVHFFMTVRSPESTDTANTKPLSKLKEEIQQLETMQYSGWSSNSGVSYKVHEERMQEAERQMIVKRLEYARSSGWTAALEERFSDILHSAPSGDILFIDDLLGRGETLAQIDEVVKTVAPDRHAEFFFFYDRRKNTPRNGSSRVSAGLTRDELVLKSKELYKYNGFAFGGRPTNPWDPGPVKPVGLRRKAEVLGVEKPPSPQKTVLLALDRDKNAMRQLRSEMSAIAARVLMDKDFNRSTAIDKLETYWDI